MSYSRKSIQELKKMSGAYKRAHPKEETTSVLIERYDLVHLMDQPVCDGIRIFFVEVEDEKKVQRTSLALVPTTNYQQDPCSADNLSIDGETIYVLLPGGHESSGLCPPCTGEDQFT